MATATTYDSYLPDVDIWLHENMGEQRKKNILIVMTITSGLFLALVGIGFVLMWRVEPMWQMGAVGIIALMAALISFLAACLARRNKIVLAAYMWLLTCVLLVSFNGMLITGLFHVLMPVYIVSIIVTGELLGTRARWGLGSIWLFLWLLLQMVNKYDLFVWQVKLDSTIVEVLSWTINISCYVFVLILVDVGNRTLRSGLNSAIRELYLANQQLRAANEMKSRFLSRMSHELRTPLNSIIGFTDLCLRGIYGSLTALQKESLIRVLESGKYLLNLINDVLDLSKIEIGALELKEELIEVEALCKTVYHMLEDDIHRKKLDSSISIMSDMPKTIIGDHEGIRRIIMNLCSNAVKFTTQGAISIEIGCGRRKGCWYVKVCDTGKGIPAGELDLIFEEFHQVAMSDTSKRQGYGLGLAIVRELVDRMGGEIRVESQVGKGSIFDVSLPLKTLEN